MINSTSLAQVPNPRRSGRTTTAPSSYTETGTRTKAPKRLQRSVSFELPPLNPRESTWRSYRSPSRSPSRTPPPQRTPHRVRFSPVQTIPPFSGRAASNTTLPQPSSRSATPLSPTNPYFPANTSAFLPQTTPHPHYVFANYPSPMQSVQSRSYNPQPYNPAASTHQQNTYRQTIRTPQTTPTWQPSAPPLFPALPAHTMHSQVNAPPAFPYRTINVRSIEDQVPYFKGNVRNQPFCEGSANIPLRLWLNALECLFAKENITDDRQRIHYLIHFCDKKSGDAHSVLSRYLEPDQIHKSYRTVVNELHDIYNDEAAETLYRAVHHAFNIKMKPGSQNVPQNVTAIETAAGRMVRAYRNRMKYEPNNDTRNVEHILLEMCMFQLMSWNLKPKVHSELIDKQAEDTDVLSLRPKLGKLLHKAPTDFGEDLLLHRDDNKISFATESACYANSGRSNMRAPYQNESGYNNKKKQPSVPQNSHNSAETKQPQRQGGFCAHCQRPGHSSADCRNYQRWQQDMLSKSYQQTPRYNQQKHTGGNQPAKGGNTSNPRQQGGKFSAPNTGNRSRGRPGNKPHSYQ